MIYRIYAQKDTFITNFQLNHVQRTGSNFGSSEILHVYKQAGVSGAVGVTATSSIARILTQFDLAGFSTVPSGSSFFLHMSDAQHDKELPSSFDLEVLPLSQSWDEGRGRDVDFFADKGVANWDKAKSNVYWSTAGASGLSPISVCHFDSGHEDLEVDVTNIVRSWLTGSLTNNGFLVRLSSTQESDSLDYYIKMFHGRETFFKDKRPYLEARWNDFTADNRNNFLFDVTGSLFLYHNVRGEAQNIPSIGTGQVGVRIVDASGTVGIFTGSYAGTPGAYSASFALATGSYSGSLFNDIWFSLANPAVVFMTGTFGIAANHNTTDVSPKRYYVTVTNLRDSYETDEMVRMNLFIRPHDYNPARVLTASLDAYGTIIDKAYYRIVNDRTDEVVVPFGTGTLKHTRLSYDQKGNFFNFQMGGLSPGNVYRISFLFDVDGQIQYLDDSGLKFRVV